MNVLHSLRCDRCPCLRRSTLFEPWNMSGLSPQLCVSMSKRVHWTILWDRWVFVRDCTSRVTCSMLLLCLAPIIRTVTKACNQNTCIHGDCSKNGTCICHNNWTSSSCNESVIIRMSLTRIRTALSFVFSLLAGETGCVSRPCLHNSTCETLTDVTPSSAYRCHCRPGYTGRNCEVGKMNTGSTRCL